ncbi:hypothetical protein NDU88_002036 [Pleurodeles waltl]|uniref:Uncharacterized protein n=1 Tax=Pleurodeles waltl TaxID=8319 RepID=A0AAV7P5N9_PLEWA|nr:hypothetical protein NDU88_002036 [Pleurodeles waltl]
MIPPPRAPGSSSTPGPGRPPVFTPTARSGAHLQAEGTDKEEGGRTVPTVVQQLRSDSRGTPQSQCAAAGPLTAPPPPISGLASARVLQEPAAGPLPTGTPGNQLRPTRLGAGPISSSTAGALRRKVIQSQRLPQQMPAIPVICRPGPTRAQSIHVQAGPRCT